MLKLLLALGLLQNAASALPPPQVMPAPLYLPVRMDGSVETLPAPSPTAEAEPELRLLVVDDQTLRMQVLLRHDEQETVDLPQARAWQAGEDLRIVLPLASRAASPFEPQCCMMSSQVDLLLTLPHGLPEHVTVHRERPRRDVIAEQRLVPQR